MSNKGYALVTGATGGLGKAFVYTLAEEGYSLILTGRSQRKLEELQREIQTQYNSLDVLYYPTDIAEEEGRARLMNWVMDKKIPLTLLANVAGVDIQKGVEVYDQRKVRLQCRVNFEAAVGIWGKLAVMDPKRVAEGSLRAVHRNRRKVIIGFWNKAMRFFTCLLPTSWRLAFIAKRWSKISKDAF